MKIAICIPVHGDTRAAFTHSLGSMLVHTMREWPRRRPDEEIEIELFMMTGALVALSREQLVTMAQEWGADWLLWLDADQTFPPSTLLRLLAHELPLVGCNYPRRNNDAMPTAVSLDSEGNKLPVWSTEEKVAAGLVEPVAFLGLGICLVSMEALAKVERPLFDAVREDLYFFAKSSAAGLGAMVDHGLSAEVGHVRNQVLTNHHSLAAKTRRESAAAFPATLKGRVGKG